ncbi:MAG TPA: hypothetical protein V6C90_20480 [Coleofasciculaceae cyanobacterium]
MSRFAGANRRSPYPDLSLILGAIALYHCNSKRDRTLPLQLKTRSHSLESSTQKRQ